MNIMENNVKVNDQVLQNGGDNEIKQLITKALNDASFKALLIENPDAAMKQFNLTEIQKMLIKSLDESDIDKLTPENLDEYFSADAAVYTPDLDSSLEVDVAGEDDI